MTHEEADFIHVRGEHDAQRRTFGLPRRFAHADIRTHRVGRATIEQPLRFFGDERADAFLATSHTRSFTETAEEIDVHMEEDSR